MVLLSRSVLISCIADSDLIYFQVLSCVFYHVLSCVIMCVFYHQVLSCVIMCFFYVYLFPAFSSILMVKNSSWLASNLMTSDFFFPVFNGLCKNIKNIWICIICFICESNV